MSLTNLTVQYEDDRTRAEIIVARANVIRGLLRSQLVDEGLRTDDDNALVHIARWTQYPAIVAGTTGGKIEFLDDDGKPVKVIRADQITFDEFLEQVPEPLMILWLDGVFESNPHWLLDVMDTPAPESPEGKD